MVNLASGKGNWIPERDKPSINQNKNGGGRGQKQIMKVTVRYIHKSPDPPKKKKKQSQRYRWMLFSLMIATLIGFAYVLVSVWDKISMITSNFWQIKSQTLRWSFLINWIFYFLLSMLFFLQSSCVPAKAQYSYRLQGLSKRNHK